MAYEIRTPWVPYTDIHGYNAKSCNDSFIDDFSGAANSNSFTFSAWIKLNTGVGAIHNHYALTLAHVGSVTSYVFRAYMTIHHTTNPSYYWQFKIYGSGLKDSPLVDAGNGVSLNSANYPDPAGYPGDWPDGTWFHVMGSGTAGTGGNVYINGGFSASWSGPYGNEEPIAFGAANKISLKSNIFGSANSYVDKWKEIYLSTAYINLTQASNRAKFISGGQPVFLGEDGELPDGVQPLIYFRSCETYNRGYGTIG